MSRGYNFNAGPAVLPEAVLEQIRDEIFEWRGQNPGFVTCLQDNCAGAVPKQDTGTAILPIDDA